MTNNNKTVSSLPFAMTELTTQAQRIVNALHRDVNELSPLGITSAKIAEFTNQIQSLIAMKKDHDHKANLHLLAQSKSQLLQELLDSLRMIEITIKTNLGSNYNCEPLIVMKSMKSLSGKQLVASLGNVFSDLKSSEVLYKSNASVKNAIDDAESVFARYSVEYAKFTDSKQTRRKSMDERLQAAFVLYAQLLNYSNLGKTFWKTKSSYRALDYKLPIRNKKPKEAMTPESQSNAEAA